MRKLRAVRFVRVVAVAMFCMVVIAPPTGAQESGSVTATVTAAAACIEVTASAVDFGNLPFSTPGNDVTEFGDADFAGIPEYFLGNCAANPASFEATGSNVHDANSGAILWYLDDTLNIPNGICADTSVLFSGQYSEAINRFYSHVVTDTNGTGFVGDTDGGGLGDSAVLLADGVSTPLAGGTGVAGDSTITVGNKITMPCSGSDGAGETVSTQITYTAILDS